MKENVKQNIEMPFKPTNVNTSQLVVKRAQSSMGKSAYRTFENTNKLHQTSPLKPQLSDYGEVVRARKQQIFQEKQNTRIE